MPRASFLELTPEVRNLIYITHLQGHSDARYVHSAGGLVATGPFRKLNQQTRQEYLSLVDVHARRIIFDIRAFEFRYVITYLNKLNTQALEAFARIPSEHVDTPTDPGNGSRQLVLNLVLEPVWSWTHADGLLRWVKRFDDPRKNGTSLRYRYTFTGISRRLRQTSRFLEALANGEDRHEFALTRFDIGSERTKAELRAMADAAKHAERAQEQREKE